MTEQTSATASGQAPELHAADAKFLARRQAGAAERLAGPATAKGQVAVQAERVGRRAAQRHALRAAKLEEVIAHDAHALLVPAPERGARLHAGQRHQCRLYTILMYTGTQNRSSSIGHVTHMLIAEMQL